MWRLLLGTMGVKSLVQGLNAAATAGFEPRTVWSEVRRRNRLATAPPTYESFQDYSKWNRRSGAGGGGGVKNKMVEFDVNSRTQLMMDRISKRKAAWGVHCLQTGILRHSRMLQVAISMVWEARVIQIRPHIASKKKNEAWVSSGEFRNLRPKGFSRFETFFGHHKITRAPQYSSLMPVITVLPQTLKWTRTS